jgi:hypothetical protein
MARRCTRAKPWFAHAPQVPEVLHVAAFGVHPRQWLRKLPVELVPTFVVPICAAYWHG